MRLAQAIFAAFLVFAVAWAVPSAPAFGDSASKEACIRAGTAIPHVIGQRLFDIRVKFHGPSLHLPKQNRERGAVQHEC